MMSSCSWQWQLQSHCYHRLRIPQSPSPSSCLLIVRKSSIGFQASITSTVFPATITVHRRRTSPLPPASLSYSSSSSPSSSFSYYQKEQQQKVDLEAEDGDVVGDCLVFEEGIFEDPFLQHVYQTNNNDAGENSKMKKSAVNVKPVYSNNKISELEATENLVPEKWRLLQEEINITKKERRKISQELEFGVRVQRKQRALLPLADYLDYKSSKLAQLKPLVLDNPSTFPDTGDDSLQKENGAIDGQTRVTPRNPKWAVYGRSLDDISHFFNSSGYQPAQNGPNQGPRKLFTKEEKMLLNRRIPDTGTANCRKWLPLHTLAASGEFYLMDALLKHNVDINAADEDGATLMHYAVRTASSHTIKILLLYNVDINLQDNAGWTPLHVAVQAQRTDLVRLLLIKGADKTVKNGDGLTPLDICLYSGRSSRTYELIKLLKKLPKSKPTS